MFQHLPDVLVAVLAALVEHLEVEVADHLVDHLWWWEWQSVRGLERRVTLLSGAVAAVVEAVAELDDGGGDPQPVETF